MSKNGSNGQGFLKEKMAGYRVDPPEEAWNRISDRLGGRSRRKMIIFTLSAAASLALALSVGLLLWGPGPDHRISEVPAVEGSAEGHSERTVQEPSGRKPREDGRTGLSVPADRPVADDMQEEVKSEERQVRETEHDLFTDKPATVAAAEIAREDAERQESPGIAPGTKSDSSGATELAELDLTAEAGDQDKLMNGREIAPAERSGRWMVGAAVSPLYSYRDADVSAIVVEDNYESAMLAYSGGVQVGYRAASRLVVETGLFFTKMGIRIGAPGIQLLRHSYEIDFSPAEGIGSDRSQVTAVSNSVGNIVATTGQVYINSYKLNGSDPGNSFADLVTGQISNAEEGISQHLEYLEIPFNLRYTVIDRDLELQLVGGMSTNFLVRNYVTSDTHGSSEQIGYLANIRDVNYSGNAGLGMIYHISSSFSFMVEPRFRYFLNSVNDESLPSTRPYTLGLYTGLNFVF